MIILMGVYTHTVIMSSWNFVQRMIVSSLHLLAPCRLRITMQSLYLNNEYVYIIAGCIVRASRGQECSICTHDNSRKVYTSQRLSLHDHARVHLHYVHDSHNHQPPKYIIILTVKRYLCMFTHCLETEHR